MWNIKNQIFKTEEYRKHSKWEKIEIKKGKTWDNKLWKKTQAKKRHQKEQGCKNTRNIKKHNLFMSCSNLEIISGSLVRNIPSYGRLSMASCLTVSPPWQPHHHLNHHVKHIVIK